MTIAAAVGPDRVNRKADVRTVQQLLNRSGSVDLLEEDGLFGPLTAAAITRYQVDVLHFRRPDGVVDPGVPTVRTSGFEHRGSATPGRSTPRFASTSRSVPRSTPHMAAPRRTSNAARPCSGRVTGGAIGPGGLTEDIYVSVAAALGCEAAAAKALVATEALRSAFDKQGRPAILFERHQFFHTGGRFARSEADIRNATAGGYGALTMTAALLLGACNPTASDANARSAPLVVGRAAAVVRAKPPVVASAGELNLSGSTSVAANAAVLAEAKRQGMTEVEIAAAQSFRVLESGRQVAALVTGKGNMPDTNNAGCFVAIVQNGEASLIPTIGYADYEAETCGGPASVGLLSGDNPVHLGMVFEASSPNAQVREPLVVSWNRTDNTLLIDDALSAKASQAGALTVAAIRKVIR